MIFLWSFWNFSWFSLSYLKLLPFNAPLKCSLFATSILGGYTIYIYPRKIVIKINKIKYNIPYPILVVGDILFHQFPLFYAITKHENNDNNTCGTAVFLPVGAWFGLNYLCKVNMDKLYSIPMKYMFTSSLVLFTGHSLCYHYIRKR